MSAASDPAAGSTVLRNVFSFPAMLGTILVGAVFFVLRGFVVDPDLWWHLKVGQDILATHRFPTSDPYSFTVAGQPWIAYEWLGEVLLARVNQAAGLRGLCLTLMILGSAVMLALYWLSTRRSGNSKAGFVTATILLVLSSVSFTLRPQMMGYLFLIVALIVLQYFRDGIQWVVWLLPPLFLAWVNVHGSFLVGLGAIAVYWAAGLKEFQFGGVEGKSWTEKQRIRLEIAFLLCLAVLPITPYGTLPAVYPFDLAWGQPVNVGNILEWQPMPFNLPGGKVFLAMIVAFVALQAAYRFRWRIEELFLFLFGLAMACLHVRFLLLFVPFFAPLCATVLAKWMPEYDRAKDKPVLNVVVMTAALAGMFWYFPARTELQESVARAWPVAAVEHIRLAGVPQPMFNTYGFGGYLLYTGQRVFIDGRADVYERGGVLSDYLHISLVKPGALAVLRGYQVQSCLLARGEALGVLLAASPEWKRIYFDSVSELFVRQ